LAEAVLRAGESKRMRPVFGLLPTELMLPFRWREGEEEAMSMVVFGAACGGR
jgi:hypothetical protein